MIILIGKLIPVLLMMLIGWVIRKKKMLSIEAMTGLKTIVFNVALPCILFLSFAQTVLETSYIAVVIIVFLMCAALYGSGTILKNKIPDVFGSIFTPWLMAGFEFGMIGIGLFTALWGVENLAILMLIGLGHEFFAWFICIPYINYKNSGKFVIKSVIKNFFQTPAIIGIFGGLAINFSGIYGFIESFFWGEALFSAMKSVSNMAVPLILIIVGYSLVLERANARKMITYIVTKLSLVMIIGTAALILIKTIAGPIDPLFNIAFYSFLILPPSYLVPVLVKSDEEERHFFSQTVVYYTILSFVGYVVLMLI